MGTAERLRLSGFQMCAEVPSGATSDAAHQWVRDRPTQLSVI